MAGAANAQQPAAPAANPLDAVPEKMPFNTPYGAPISLEKAQAAIQAAVAEANKRGWPLNVAVVDSGGSLVTFARMDGAQLASIAVSAAQGARGGKIPPADEGFRRSDAKRLQSTSKTLDGIIASRGGIPLVEDGKLIGAIGCSGGTGSQDEVVCTAGAATINK